MRTTIILILVSISCVFLAGAASSQGVEQEILLGEEAVYKGVFCRNESAADRVFSVETSADMITRFNIEGLCVLHESRIVVLGLQKTYTIDDDVWNLVQVRTPDGMVHFIVTKLPVYSGQTT